MKRETGLKQTESSRFCRLKSWAEQLKQEIFTIYLVFLDNRTPISARLIAGAVVAYVFSPIDLIPDFIPILGYLDDLILLPLGITLVIHLVPAEVFKSCRKMAKEHPPEICMPGWTGLILVVSTWIIFMALFYVLFLWITNSLGGYRV